MVELSARHYLYAAIIQISATLINCYDVIIIGAGASGIAAGIFLLENGINSILILEAEKRIGGRINTTRFGESFVDLGAEWSLGEDQNVVYNIAVNFNVLKPVNESYKLIYSNGGCIDGQLGRQLVNVRSSFSDDLFSIRRRNNLTLEKAFTKYYDDKILSKYSTDPVTLKICMESLASITRAALTHESFFSWDEVPVKNNYRKCNGKVHHWNGLGFNKILEIMMNEFPDSTEKHRIHSKIRFNSEVKRIIWTGYTSNVRVEDNHGYYYTANHVIFTPSLGVLKEKYSSLFEPNLPAHKRKAIDCLGFEGVLKIFLSYSEPWWSGQFHPSLLVWKAEDIINMEKIYFLDQRDTESWLFSLTQFLPSPNNPNVIVAWFTGKFSSEIEKLPDEDLLEGIMFVLHKFYDKMYNVTQPIQILRSSWNSSPNFLGSHTFETNKTSASNESCNEDLATPLYSGGKPVVLFAGEATSKHHYSTVHGAIEAGEREGERVLNYYPQL